MNKKYVNIVIITICLACTGCSLNSKSTNDENNAPKSNEIEKQIEIIANNYNLWKGADDEYSSYVYTVTDLDHNGRLEVISSTCQGTGMYTYSNFYELNENLDAIKKISRDIEEGDSEADIAVSRVKLFTDNVNNEYHYIFTDLIKNGAAEYYENKQDFVLNNGKLEEKVLAYKETNYSTDIENCFDASRKPITLEEYSDIENNIYKNMDSNEITIKWFEISSETADTNLKDILLDSYNGFNLKAEEQNDINNSSNIDDNRMMLNKYKEILNAWRTESTLPNGFKVDFDEATDISQNNFAIYDIDFDGKNELIINHVTSYMAGMVSKIYDFDYSTNTVTEELTEFPLLTYYDNGTIVALFSHNQGLAGENFWPYTLYKYDVERDKYIEVAMVDAWDKSYADADSNNNAFPDEIDKNNNGIVFYIMTDGKYDNSINPVSKEDYEEWRSSYINDANQLNIPFKSLTEENINSI